MPLDEQLLLKTRAFAEQLARAERDAQLARAAYHTSVRLMHLGGASLREIADALAISHQRVQQIVNEAGGSWWQRVWRTRNARTANCTFCGRTHTEVTKLIAGPKVFICDRCVAAAERSATKGASSPFTRAETGSGKCSFCGKWRGAGLGGVRLLLTAPPGNICDECLRACRNLLDD
jgi:hypothetical protein